MDVRLDSRLRRVTHWILSVLLLSGASALAYAPEPKFPGGHAADNLNARTNGAMIEAFTVNPLNELMNESPSGALLISGNTPAPATNITVNGETLQTYSDLTFAGTNNTLKTSPTAYPIIAQNAFGLSATNTVTVDGIPVTLRYDANGNLTNDGTRSFAYDAENRLTNVNVAGNWRSDFVYDGLGRRRIERDLTWSGSAWVKTNEVRLICDGLLPIQERDSNNAARVKYTRGLDLSGSLAGAGGIGGLLARTDGNGSTFYHSDGEGNVTALIDGYQVIPARYLYDPFGRPLGQWGALAAANTMQFSSMPHHGNSGLSLYAFRAYDPTLSRFTSPDPIGESGGVNLYTFIGNSSLNAVDPLGLEIGYTYNPDGSMTGPDLSFENAQENLAYAQGFLEGLFHEDYGTDKNGNPIYGGTPPFPEEAFANDAKALGDLAKKLADSKAGKALADLAKKLGKKCEGIYKFPGKSKKPYIGQSKDIANRLKQHVGSGKLSPNEIPNVEMQEVPGGKTMREIAEQQAIDAAGGLPNTENLRNPIGPYRQYLIP